jgi:hypothetical protein
MLETLIPVTIAAALAALVELYLYVSRRIIHGDNTVETAYQTGNTGDLQDIEPGLTQEPASPSARSGMLIKNWIITHTDFDGFTSGALLLRLLGSETGFLFSSPGSLLKKLKTASAGLIESDSIYIADLALQPHTEHNFADCLNDLRNRGIKVIWIDHHEWPAGLVNRMESICSQLVVDPSEKTAAAIIRRMLPADDAHAERLLKFVQHRSDEDDAEWDERWRAALAELAWRRDPEMSETLLRSWANNEDSNVLLNYLARQGRKREQATQDIANYLHRREKTAHNRSLLVIDVRTRRLERDERGRMLFVMHGYQPSMMVGKQACNSQHGDFCIILWEDFRYSVYRGLDNALDFGGMFGETEIKDAVYRVGGHRYAVSVRVLPSLWAQIRALFRWRPAPEAELFISYLKERY